VEQVLIFDTTLRDGEQAPGFSMNTRAKLAMANQLARLRVDVIEAGFPISSADDFEATRAVAREIGTVPNAPIICGLARIALADIDHCWEAVRSARRPRIHTFVATSDIHLTYKLRRTRQEILAAAVAAVRHARSYCDDVEFSAEDASRSDPSFLADVFEAVVGAGATTINIPDTVGYALPDEWRELLLTLLDRAPALRRVVLSVHCHNDLGLAVANSLAAVTAGARQVECTINGIGERAGNAALEEIVMALRTRRDRLPYDTGVQTSEIVPASRLLTELTGVSVQPNKAIVGDNAFAHEAGIHQDGVLKAAATYEIMRPTDVGHPSNRLVLGKHSGRHAFGVRLQALGFELSDREVDEVFVRFKCLADAKRTINDEDLRALMQVPVS